MDYPRIPTASPVKKMMLFVLAILALATVTLASGRPALAASAATIDREADAALAKLMETTPVAKMLAGQAKGILIFPNIVKAGFIVGAQYGDGALKVNGKTAGYYNIVAASYGLQAGIQSFAYAMFFMTDAAMNYFQKSEGFEVGVGPSVVVVDAGVAKSLTTTTAQSDVYSFIFGQQGLMAGLGLQGSKITRINP
jgi:lipid-binding SYLF domain-containing protein